MIGTVTNINQTIKKFAVKHDNDTFSIVEFLEPTQLSIGDIVKAQFVTGDVFVHNQTQNLFFEGYIHLLEVSDREMRKQLEIH